MKKRLLAIVIAALAVGGLSATAAGGPLAPSTWAAWADRTQVAAKVTAGTWTMPDTCVWYDAADEIIPGCTVVSSRVDEWGEAPTRTRGYDINFAYNWQAVRTSFDVDLKAVSGAPSVWTWGTAQLTDAAGFAPSSGWTCSELPRVRGTTTTSTSSVHLKVTESATGGAAVCP